MANAPLQRPLIAVACGGTGGHLYPGQAVAEVLNNRGCDVLLLLSDKAIDRQAAQSMTGLPVAILPAVGWEPGRFGAFLKGVSQSFRECRKLFRPRPPRVVLSMGGFTGTGPVLAGKCRRAVIVLHESNAIPGRANRWLAHLADQVLVGFASAAPKLSHQWVVATGTPVRAQMHPAEPQACRIALGFNPDRPVLLIQGGSQGARSLNQSFLTALPSLAQGAPQLQFLHLTGVEDADAIMAAYARLGLKAGVFAFLTEMELALGAATLCVSRAGASSLAELAAMRVPSILIPYPHAVDQHQYWNARAYVDHGAARMLTESELTPERLVSLILELTTKQDERDSIQHALARFQAPLAAELVADKILAHLPEFDETQANRTGHVPAAREPEEAYGGRRRPRPSNQAAMMT